MALIAVLLVAIFQVVCFWKLFEKAGYQGAWGLVSIIPLANLALLAFLAFSDWPKHGPRPGTFD